LLESIKYRPFGLFFNVWTGAAHAVTAAQATSKYNQRINMERRLYMTCSLMPAYLCLGYFLGNHPSPTCPLSCPTTDPRTSAFVQADFKNGFGFGKRTGLKKPSSNV
jgi:hypothetical protein